MGTLLAVGRGSGTGDCFVVCREMDYESSPGRRQVLDYLGDIVAAMWAAELKNRWSAATAKSPS